MNQDVEKIRLNQQIIQKLHAEEKYEEALDTLEESQRIVKTHYGTQSTEVSSFFSIFPNATHVVYEHLHSNLQHLQHAGSQVHEGGQELRGPREAENGRETGGE